ncbi:hypothetical protein [Corallococcus sp. EGB]|uniref:hypothetical protein n=1 Tax=Corallococcus sp. EGB TaxID=1521117 RepID=UPI001CBDC7A8|nr:hypothetical protein [Corallococcus sp. EGB]
MRRNDVGHPADGNTARDPRGGWGPRTTAALSEGKMPQVSFFAGLLGFALVKLGEHTARTYQPAALLPGRAAPGMQVAFVGASSSASMPAALRSVTGTAVVMTTVVLRASGNVGLEEPQPPSPAA